MLLKTNPIASEYELKEEIGRGSFSVVRRAVSRSNRQECAVKIIDKSKRCRKKQLNRLKYRATSED